MTDSRQCRQQTAQPAASRQQTADSRQHRQQTAQPAASTDSTDSTDSSLTSQVAHRSLVPNVNIPTWRAWIRQVNADSHRYLSKTSCPLNFSYLCLSRACLGKLIVLYIKVAPRRAFPAPCCCPQRRPQPLVLPLEMLLTKGQPRPAATNEDLDITLR